VAAIKDILEKKLLDGVAEMSVTLDTEKKEKLIRYIQEFEKWNKTYNLTAVRDIEQMVTRHLLDSLSVAPFIKKNKDKLESIIDVGTGGGLPGIPLAIMFPEKKITLLDSNGKKTRFLFHIKTILSLSNIAIENCRVEEYKPIEKFDAVISRAFASLEDMTKSCRHLLKENGLFLAMKGVEPKEELVRLAKEIDLVSIIKLNVAETEGKRHLVVLKNK
jgi:16S rRNA (guanine527-N7)-methyltransferase